MLNHSTSALPSLPLKFSFDRRVLSDQGELALELRGDNPVLQQAVLHNLDVPKPDEPIIIAAAGLTIDSGKTLALGSGAGKVTFSGTSAMKFGIFGQPAQLRDAIVDGGDLAESIERALDFSTGALRPFLLLRLGYDVNGTAKGAVALGGGTGTFSVNAGRAGLYALIRQAPEGLGIREAIGSVVSGVKLPKQVQSPDDLQPGTWIIAESDGSIGLRADVTFGHDFSWIRETTLGTLKGDIGLKVAAGISAGLGFNASGKYAIAISRESLDPASKVVRLRVFKLRMREWNFAFSAQATVTPVAGILPDQVDDFLAGVLGTHSGQVMAALRRIDDWTDPATPIFGPFVNMAVSDAQTLVKRLTGVDDLPAAFEQLKQRFRTLSNAWDRLPANATARVMKLAGNVDALARVRDLARMVATADDDDTLKAFLTDRLRDVAFLQTDEGKLLESLAERGLFAAITNTTALPALRQSAGTLLQVLDGSVVEKLLTSLQGEIGKRLRLAQIDHAVESADLATLDPWLRARLEDFLEEKLTGSAALATLQQLRDNLRTIRAAMPELYKKALKALQSDYAFSLNATYQQSSTSTALVDLELDFAAPGSSAAELLRVALQGRFDEVIGATRPGVKVRQGVLTDSMRRETNVAVVLPHFSRTTTHTNEAMAQLSRVSESDGRLFFQLTAEDLVSVKNSYAASLSISMRMAQGRGTGDVRVHSDDAASYVQSINRAFADETADEFVRYARPFVEPLFAGEFGTSDFAGWVKEAFGDGALGKMLMQLTVTLPPSASLAWFAAPLDEHADAYQRLSMRLQASFKQLIHDTFFQRIDRYDNVSALSDAFAVLVFSSIPPCTNAQLQGGMLRMAPGALAADGQVYWNHPDPDLRAAMLTSPGALQRLRARMAVARARLQGAGDPRSRVPFYKDSQLATIIATARDGEILRGLLFVEARIVEKAREAALAMAQFTASSGADPARARKALVAFGSDVTEAFNSRLKTVAVGDALLPLGALLFVEAARAFDPALDAAASAMLMVADVKDTIVFPPANFPSHDALPPADIVRTEVLVHTPAAS